MRIGDPTPPPAPASPPAGGGAYQTPAEELYVNVLEAFNGSSVLTRIAMGAAFERHTPWRNVSREVRELFEGVVQKMGIGD